MYTLKLKTIYDGDKRSVCYLLAHPQANLGIRVTDKGRKRTSVVQIDSIPDTVTKDEILKLCCKNPGISFLGSGSDGSGHFSFSRLLQGSIPKNPEEL
jgi:hypothetical protein